MAPSTASALDQAAIDAFLASQSTGTLSFAKENESYAVPVGFTYAPETGDIYFRLGYAPGSRKREYIEATDRATFVVAAETDAGWQSVVARGRLEHRNTVDELAKHRLPGESVSQADRELAIPFYHVFEAPDEMVFALVRLEVDELTGVAEATDDDRAG
jgi:nitroimidazol reductase NimA-like FMN-containing flavoprotein (pyridoxamine 5'-phosphate oxidase superfamily)